MDRLSVHDAVDVYMDMTFFVQCCAYMHGCMKYFALQLLSPLIG